MFNFVFFYKKQKKSKVFIKTYKAYIPTHAPLFFIPLLRRSRRSIEYQAKSKKQTLISKNFVILVFKTCELNKILFFSLLYFLKEKS